jgi:two-component system chemotaxis sensor kinase CheA
MDRNVIEELSDPMTHIIRNAIDHGIEDGETRTKNGKKAKGTIYLGARYEGSEIWITIRDDGRGLDREKIIAKAVERHLVKPEEAAILDDQQVWRFLLEPGFSTAEKISELSGRGVGMDVVKQNIDTLRGKIDINTTPGKETEFILKIPLTLSIHDGIIIKVGNVHYAVPLSDIREFQRANQDYISKTKTNLEVLRLRDEIIPVVRMSDFFNVGNGSSGLKEQVFLIIQVNNRPTALLVDEIIGYHQIVMKSLPDFMGHIRGLSGCSIMGNGEVTFIINPSALIVEESI